MDLWVEKLHWIPNKVNKNKLTPKTRINKVDNTKDNVKTLKTSREKRWITLKEAVVLLGVVTDVRRQISAKNQGK